MPPPCAFSQEEERILCDGAPYAELVRRECTSQAEAGGEAYLVPAGGGCRFLGIRYVDGSRATIYAARSFDAWGTSSYNPRGKSEAIEHWASEIAFDPASGTVTFRQRGIFTSSSWSYDVGTGVLAELD